jgi:hypothetical protein
LWYKLIEDKEKEFIKKVKEKATVWNVEGNINEV